MISVINDSSAHLLLESTVLRDRLHIAMTHTASS